MHSRARDGFYCLFKGETLAIHRGQKDRVHKRSAHRVESSLPETLIPLSFEMRFPFLNRRTFVRVDEKEAVRRYIRLETVSK